MNLANENEEFDLPMREIREYYSDGDRIYKYSFAWDCFELVAEPDNPFDAHAIAVVVDGEIIAHVKKGSCSRVRKLLAAPDFSYVEGEIRGGPVKICRYDEEKDRLEVENENYSYQVRFRIIRKTDLE